MDPSKDPESEPDDESWLAVVGRALQQLPRKPSDGTLDNTAPEDGIVPDGRDDVSAHAALFVTSHDSSFLHYYFSTETAQTSADTSAGASLGIPPDDKDNHRTFDKPQAQDDEQLALHASHPFTDAQHPGAAGADPHAELSGHVARHPRNTFPAANQGRETTPSEASIVQFSSNGEFSSFGEEGTGDNLLGQSNEQCTNPRVALSRQAAPVLRAAFERFTRWVYSGEAHVTAGTAYEGQGGGPPNTLAPAEADLPLPRSGPADRKRKRSNTTGDDGEKGEDEDEDDPSGPKRSKKVKADAGEDVGPFFACPFYKHDMASHHRCLSLALRRVRDVKQHLVRRHLQPLFCVVCGATFASQDLQESHMLERLCLRPDNFRRPSGITNSHRQKLATRVSKMLSGAEQWFSVWDIIFPGEARPQSPYVSDDFVEAIEQVRRFWEDNGRAIIADQLNTTTTSYELPDEEKNLSVLFLECGRQMMRAFTATMSARDTDASQLANSAGDGRASTTGATLLHASLPGLTMDGSAGSAQVLSEPLDNIEHGVHSPVDLELDNDFNLDRFLQQDLGIDEITGLPHDCYTEPDFEEDLQSFPGDGYAFFVGANADASEQDIELLLEDSDEFSAGVAAFGHLLDQTCAKYGNQARHLEQVDGAQAS